MLEAFILNPPRRKARRSKRRGRNARGWFGKAKKGGFKRRIGKRRNRRTVYTHPTRKTRRKSRRSRRRNPGSSYAINPRRRRKSSRRRKNPGSSYAINPRRRRKSSRRRKNPGMGLSLGANLPSVLNIKLPGFLNKGILGKIANGVVQGSLAGGVVFGGYVLSGYVVEMVEPKLPAALQGKFTRPVLYGAVAGLMGTAVAMVAPKGKRGLWSLLAASGAGLRAFGSMIKVLITTPPAGGFTAKLYQGAVGLADYIQVGEEAYEAGMSDYIQVGEEAFEAGMSEDESDAEEEVVIG